MFAAPGAASASMSTSELHAAGGGGYPDKAVAEASASWQGSTTNSLGSATELTEEEPILTPSASDCRRLLKMKAEQEQRLKMLRTRVDRLSNHEQRVWKDVTVTQQRSLQAQEAQWRRQAKKGERLRIERDLLAQEQVLRERVHDAHMRIYETKDAPRLQVFQDNRQVGKQVREDSKQLMTALKDVREQTLQSKVMRVEVQRQQQRQTRLRRELDRTRREQAVQDNVALKYAELQEEIQNGELALAAAEHEELSAVSRLQNSQSVRSEVVNQLQEIEERGLAGDLDGDIIDADEAHLANGGVSGSRCASGGAAVPRSMRQGQGHAGPVSHRSRLAGSSHHGRGHGHMASGYASMGLDQITEEHHEDEGAERFMEEPDVDCEDSMRGLI